MFFGKKAKRIKIEEIMTRDGNGTVLPLIGEKAGVDEIIDIIIKTGHSRHVFVVDEEKKLKGTISLKLLVEHVFSKDHEIQIHPRRLMKAITMETAKHMMQKHPVYAKEGEELGPVVERMISSNLEELAVLNQEHKVVGDLTLVNVLQHLAKNSERSEES